MEHQARTGKSLQQSMMEECFSTRKQNQERGNIYYGVQKKKRKSMSLYEDELPTKKKEKEKEMLRIVNIEKNVQMDESMERSMMVMRNSIRIRV